MATDTMTTIAFLSAALLLAGVSVVATVVALRASTRTLREIASHVNNANEFLLRSAVATDAYVRARMATQQHGFNLQGGRSLLPQTGTPAAPSSTTQSLMPAAHSNIPVQTGLRQRLVNGIRIYDTRPVRPAADVAADAEASNGLSVAPKGATE